MLFKHPLDIIILSTDIFLTVSTEHLMRLPDETGEDSGDNENAGKIRCKRSIHFIKEMVLVEGKRKGQFWVRGGLEYRREVRGSVGSVCSGLTWAPELDCVRFPWD